MAEWWTYDIGDLVLYTPETWYRLFELYHRDWWPVQLVCKTMTVVILLILWLKPAGGVRVISLLLAMAWAWTGWMFLHDRLAPIHWVADWYAVAFGLQAMLLLACGFWHRDLKFDIRGSARAGIGVFILLVALLVMPALAYLTGRDWRQTELFGMTPDATVLATMGLLLLVQGRVWPLLVIPVFWCIASGATLWALEAPEAMLLPTAAVLVVSVVWLFSYRQ